LHISAVEVEKYAYAVYGCAILTVGLQTENWHFDYSCSVAETKDKQTANFTPSLVYSTDIQTDMADVCNLSAASNLQTP